MRLDGKVAVVAGAASSRGLGYATALELAGLGAHVALVDLEEGLARRAAAQWGDAHWGFGCDPLQRRDASPQGRWCVVTPARAGPGSGRGCRVSVGILAG